MTKESVMSVCPFSKPNLATPLRRTDLDKDWRKEPEHKQLNSDGKQRRKTQLLSHQSELWTSFLVDLRVHMERHITCCEWIDYSRQRMWYRVLGMKEYSEGEPTLICNNWSMREDELRNSEQDLGTTDNNSNFMRRNGLCDHRPNLT